ncbi:MAG: autotransporter domain-containing protein [Succinivibrio sp.]|nr:autotransporter domain-containing protein [Succinivibrio sp.]
MLKVKSFAHDSSIALTSTASTFTVGSTLQANGTVSVSDSDGDSKDDTVTYTIDPTKYGSALSAQMQTHAVTMVASAATTALNKMSETSEVALMNLSASGNADTQLFCAVGGGFSRVETGSHVSLRSVNLSFGVGNNHKIDYGRLSWGVAFETGYSVFHSHYDAGAAEPFVSKKGHLNFYGGAILGKFDFNNLYHANATLRAGHIYSKQNNGLYDSSSSQNYDVKLNQSYFGIELGGGKIIKIDDINSVGLYAKYYYLHQDLDSFYAGGNYTVHSINSHRLKIAGRYQYNVSKRGTLYAGLGGEYEFDGKAELTLDYGVKADSSKIDGFRTCAEVGFILKPDENMKGLSFDIAVKGRYGSKYRDIFANAEVKYYF